MSSPDVAGLPWPEGDVGGLRSGAKRVDAAAARLEGTGGTVAGIGVPGGWSGAAAAAFGGAVDRHSSLLTRASNGLTDVAGALEKLAAKVEDAQEQVRKLAEQVRAAEERAREARSLANIAESAAAVAPGPLAPVAKAAAAASSANAGDAEGDAAATRSRATAEAEALCDEVRRLDSATASDITGAKAPMGGNASAPVSPPSMALGSIVAPLFAPWYRLDSREGVPPTRMKYTFTVTDDGRLQIQYWRYHPSNDYPYSTEAVYEGDHADDWERTTVQFDAAGRPAFVGFDAHDDPSLDQTGVLPWEDVELGGGTHPVVYVALGAHGSYPRRGNYSGRAPVLPDHADGEGDWWRPGDPGYSLDDGRDNADFYDDDLYAVAAPGNQTALQDLETDYEEDGPIEPHGGVRTWIENRIDDDLDRFGEGLIVAREGAEDLYHGAREGAEDLYNGARRFGEGVYNGAREGAEDLYNGAREGAEDLYHGAREGAEDLYNGAREGAEDLYHGAREGAEDLYHGARETGEDALETADEAIDTAGDAAEDVLEEIPRPPWP